MLTKINQKGTFSLNLLTVALLAASSNLHAEETTGAFQPAEIELDSGASLIPTVKSELVHNDNIYLSAENKKSSSILTVNPNIELLASDEVNAYELNVGLKSQTYFSSSDDNVLGGYLQFESQFNPSERSSYSVEVYSIWDAEQRGTGITQNQEFQQGNEQAVPEPLEFLNQGINLGYRFGGQSASSVELNGGVEKMKYDDNTELARQYTQDRNFEAVNLEAAYIFSTENRTDLSLSVAQTSSDFDTPVDGGIERDYDDLRILAGLSWQATAMTTGELKLGYQDRSFDEAERGDFDDVSWELSVQWTPLTYSQFELVSSKSAKDSGLDVDYVDESLYQVSWAHNWTDKTRSLVSAAYIEEFFSRKQVTEATDGFFNREDESVILRAQLEYAFERWLVANLFVQHNTKDSTLADLQYDQNVLGLELNVSM